MTEDELQKYVPESWPYKYGKTIWLPGYLPPSMNIMLRKSWNTFGKRQERKRIGTLLFGAGIAYLKPAGAKEKRGLVVVQERNRFLDKDNLGASVKVMLDTLRDFKVIRNDSEASLDEEVTQVHAPKDAQGTNIIILAMEPLEEA